jgi:hypothetical protein
VSGDLDAIAFARAEEQLRQEREAFDQFKMKDKNWFYLQLVVGGSSVVLLISIVVICCYIFLHSGVFPEFVVKAASAALFGDVVGLLVLVWKVILNASDTKALAPVTKAIPEA